MPPPPSISATADAVEFSVTAPVSDSEGVNEHRVAFIMFGVTIAVCAGFIAMIVAEVL